MSVDADAPPSHLDALLRGVRSPPPFPPAQAAAEDVWDGPPNGAWRAARGRPEYGIDFEWPDGRSIGFEYASLVRREFVAGRVVLTFLADELVRVTIHGRGLRPLYELIRGHRVAVVHVAGRDMAADGEAIVTDVRIEPASRHAHAD